MRFLLRILLRLIFLPLILLLGAILHLIPPIYKFPAAKPFSGKVFYNPYRDIDSVEWKPANFHMHGRAWGGITNGKSNNDSEIWKYYHEMGFKSISISNYQNINTLYKDSSFHIPAYEHGYGIYKNHHLCLDAHKVNWFDMPFKQTASQKQFVINRLKNSCRFVAINHPSFFNGYTEKDFTQLTGYDFIEAINGYRRSFGHWDAALSAGRCAFLTANDDMHNLDNIKEPARCFMLINTPTNKKNDVFSALEKGAVIGIMMPAPEYCTFEQRKEQISQLPVLKNVTIENDSLKVEFNQVAFYIKFYGQNGKPLGKLDYIKKAAFPVTVSDPYIRVQAVFSTKDDPEGLQYFLNPIVRTNDGNKPKMPIASVDVFKTVLIKTAILLAVWYILYLFFKRRKRRKAIKAA